MLGKYFEAPFVLERLRSGPSGPFLDGFARVLHESGYSWWGGRRYLRVADHLGRFLAVGGLPLCSASQANLQAFGQHLAGCRCPHATGGRAANCALPGAAHFIRHLRELGVVESEDPEVLLSPVVESFGHWLRQHRGAAESTVYRYCQGAEALLEALGKEPNQYNAQDLRKFVLDRARLRGTGSAMSLVTALRGFLRFLATQGLCPAGLDQAIPTVARWRLASLPRYLPGDEVDRIVQACDPSLPMGQRDRAVILLLARLGLRAGDVAGLRFSDIDWADGSLLVSGKGRREVRLPLPQDVGDAILKYVASRPDAQTDSVFVRAVAPFRPFRSGSTLSAIVARAMRRAKVVAPFYGAHILRHTAATEMLRRGATLYEIGAVLRHRSIDMTAYYAKVDVNLLKQVAQPWPEVL
jgi:integrase